MITTRQAIASPELIARVPGPWKSLTALQAALPHGAEQTKEGLVMRNQGGTFELSIRPMDRELPKIFATSKRRQLTPEELQQIQNAQAIVGIVGRGGSVEAARRMLVATAQLVRAGGYGVFLDHSGCTHLASDWLELACHADEIDAMIYAFVSMVRGSSELYSLGMHAFGCRDAAVVCRDHASKAEFLAVFLQSVALNLVPLEDGTMYVNEIAGPFHIASGVCQRVPRHSPLHNPYGLWRLTQSPAKQQIRD